MSEAYIIGAKQAQTLGSNRVRKARKVKEQLTWRQRLRKWFNKDLELLDECIVQDIEPTCLDSEGMRLQIYRASGGYVVETRYYDRHKDRNFNTMHVITEDQDLGNALGKIVMMEALQR